MSLIEAGMGAGQVAGLQPFTAGIPSAAVPQFIQQVPAFVLNQPLSGSIARGAAAISMGLWQAGTEAVRVLKTRATFARDDLTHAAIQFQATFGGRMDLVSFALAAASTGDAGVLASSFPSGAMMGATHRRAAGVGEPKADRYNLRVLGPSGTPIGNSISIPTWVLLITSQESKVGKHGEKLRRQTTFHAYAYGEMESRLSVVFDDRWSLSWWSVGEHGRGKMLQRVQEILDAMPEPREGTSSLLFERDWTPPAPPARAVASSPASPGFTYGGRPLATPESVIKRFREREAEANEGTSGDAAANCAIDMGYMVNGNPEGLRAFIDEAGRSDFAAEVLAMFISVYHAEFQPDQIPLLDAIAERIASVREIMETSRELGRFPPRG